MEGSSDTYLRRRNHHREVDDAEADFPVPDKPRRGMLFIRTSRPFSGLVINRHDVDGKSSDVAEVT